MAVKTLTITASAYDRLAALKRPGESFSEVIERIVAARSVRDLVGVLDPRAAAALARGAAAARRDLDRHAARSGRSMRE